MLELERVRGLRVVADAAALDAARWTGGDVTVLRLVPDEALALGATAVDVADEHAIIEDEAGFVAIATERAVVERHTEWPLPSAGAVAQGAIAGIPAKLAWLPDGRAWIVTYAAYADELLDRLR